MLTFDTRSQTYRLAKGSVVYHFYSRFCVADFRNGAARREGADDNRFGCWFCGKNLI